MDGGSGRKRCAAGCVALALAMGLSSCGPRAEVGQLPSAESALAAAGKRLSGGYSAGALTAMAARGDRVLAALTRAERDALARGYLRFTIDRPADVFVAVPRGPAPPFWLADQGFAPAGMTLDDPDVSWVVHRKRFAAGAVGLGVNGLDRSPRAHYAVFVRSADGGPVSIAGLDPGEWESLWVVDRLALERDVLRPVRDLPDALRRSTLLRTRHDRRHAALLARGRVWKTHVVSGRTPDQVAVAFGEDPATELVWSWRTAPEVVASVVRVRKFGSTGGPAVEVRGGSDAVALPDLLNDPVVRRHTARLAGLEPATAYEYSLGDGTPSGMSAWAAVRTAPRRGEDVSLLAMGDPQCGLEGWGKLLDAAYEKRPDACALLIAGDLVDRGNERTNWDHFFLRASGVFPRLAVMPAAGNHEYLDRGPWLYRAFFALPENGPDGVAPELAYQFEIGDAFVAVLDSTAAVSDPRLARAQADWLDERLARTARTWKVVMFHHPVYASHPTRESPSLRDAWVPVFDRHGVDLVLQGHDHAYLRTYPLRAGRRARGPGGGTVYVVSVSGDKYCDQDPRDYTEVGFTRVSTYQTIDVLARERRLVYRSFDLAGRERDAFTIEKPAAGAVALKR